MVRKIINAKRIIAQTQLMDMQSMTTIRHIYLKLLGDGPSVKLDVGKTSTSLDQRQKFSSGFNCKIDY